MRQLKFASIFSGCGGFDLGFIEQGFQCVAAFDNDPLAIEVHRQNIDAPATALDLTNGFTSDRSLIDLDVLLAGPPCQGFSIAGKRDFSDPRNGLLLRAGKIAVEVRPKVFIVENVSGVNSGEHKYYWESLQRMLRIAGYKTLSVLCEANKMGVPQIRKRVILIAWRVSKELSMVLPEIPGGSLRTALINVNGVPNHEVKRLPSESDLLLIARHIKAGQKLSNVGLTQEPC